MATIMSKTIIWFILTFSVAFSSAPNPLKYAKPKLSDYGFFKHRMADHIPAEGVIPYSVSAQLFSDYALKSRFIVLPEGQRLQYKSDGLFDFPPIFATLIKRSS